MHNISEKYLVITADMISSHQYSTDMMGKLPDLLSKTDELMKPVVPSVHFAGDEIQMMFILDNNIHPYKMMLELSRQLYPFRFRFGFGVGDAGQPVKKILAQNKGPAFIRARNALNYAKKENLLAWTEGDSNKMVADINCTLLLFAALTKKWSEKHWRRFFEYWKNRSIYKVAELENVSAESINKFLTGASIRKILQSIDIITDIRHD